ncbi:fimbrial protein, partial [Buttiauxella ferragutiae]|uniref:fimbrial protein n=1 Tax=Buttiauxella ferragutiae TaxID=82989 RepID=UPI003525BF6E
MTTPLRSHNNMNVKSKITRLICATALSLLTNLAQADTIQFAGTVVAEPCNISLDTADQTVDLGKVPAVTLNRNEPITPVPFELTVENCTFGSGPDAPSPIVGIGFHVKGEQGGNEFRTTGGTNTAIAIQTSTHEEMDLDSQYWLEDLQPGGKRTVSFFAVVQKAHDKISVTPGSFALTMF